MLKKKISRSNFFYKPYLFYNLFVHHKYFLKRKSYSQFQEDLFISSYFKNKKIGFYVDIGCFHPIMYSNTALLYNKGWKGINIDVSQTSIDLFNIIRKRDKNFCAAISNKNSNVISYIDHSFSPINSINKIFFDKTVSNFSNGSFLKKKLKAYKFSDFLEDNNFRLNYIDFLNIDAEGHDFEVLQGFDFESLNVKLVCVEMFGSKGEINYNKFIEFFKNYGYRHIKSIGPNGFFENNN